MKQCINIIAIIGICVLFTGTGYAYEPSQVNQGYDATQDIYSGIFGQGSAGQNTGPGTTQGSGQNYGAVYDQIYGTSQGQSNNSSDNYGSGTYGENQNDPYDQPYGDSSDGYSNPPNTGQLPGYSTTGAVPEKSTSVKPLSTSSGAPDPKGCVMEGGTTRYLGCPEGGKWKGTSGRTYDTFNEMVTGERKGTYYEEKGTSTKK